ncbi:hypothetical protein Hanom_Chr06g00519401 [Helianthus anomalus]
MKEAYDKMNKSAKQFVDLTRELDATNYLLKSTVMDKQTAINIHIDTISKLKQELEKAKIETEWVNKKLISYSTSSYVLDHIFLKQTKRMNLRRKLTGMGTKGQGIIVFLLP